jgi:hypothetical protein
MGIRGETDKMILLYLIKDQGGVKNTLIIPNNEIEK